MRTTKHIETEAQRRTPARRADDLDVWQEAHRLVLEVYRLTRRFPADEKFGLTSQLRRAAASVPANIVEGFRRESPAEKARFLNIAQGSLDEAEYFLKLARDLGYFSKPESFPQVEMTSRLLNAYKMAIQRTPYKRNRESRSGKRE